MLQGVVSARRSWQRLTPIDVTVGGRLGCGCICYDCDVPPDGALRKDLQATHAQALALNLGHHEGEQARLCRHDGVRILLGPCSPHPHCFVIVWFPVMHHVFNPHVLVRVAYVVCEVQEVLLSEAAAVLRVGGGLYLLSACSRELLTCFG